MPRRSKKGSPEKLRSQLVSLLSDFKNELMGSELRKKVQSLVPANHLLRDLGSSLIDGEETNSAISRILAYLRKYPRLLIHGDELMVVSGIGDYPRRIRELRVELGWSIFSGKSLKEIGEDGDSLEGSLDEPYDADKITTDTYVLMDDNQDRDAAYRWKVANKIRRSKSSVKNKILTYLRENVGKRVTGEELKYLARDRSEWARRVRELRTEDGWPVMTRFTGVRELPAGYYILESDKQAPAHDRKIPDPLRVSVLERDNFECRICHWSKRAANPNDTIRNLLELHHIQEHARKGENSEENLITLCNMCHDEVHRGNIKKSTLLELLNN